MTDTIKNKDEKILEGIGEYKYGFHDSEDKYVFKSQKGLSREVVEQISQMKGEPQWMLDFRLKALEHFIKRAMPDLGAILKDLNFDEIYFYVKPNEKQEKSWDDVPDDIKRTFDKLGRAGGRTQVSGRPGRAVRIGDGLSLHSGTSRKAGRDLPVHRRWPEEVPGSVP